MNRSTALVRRFAGAALCLLLAFHFAPSPVRAALQEPDYKQWSLLAVQDEGRVKPLDTFAHEALLRLTGGSFLGMAAYKDTTGKVWHPNDFLLSVLLGDAHDWRKEPLILVNYRPLIQKLKLDLKLDPERKRFSLEELSALPALDAIAREARALRMNSTTPHLTREQQEVESIRGRMVFLDSLLRGESLLIVPRPAADSANAAPGSPDLNAGTKHALRTTWLVPSDEARDLYGAERFAAVNAAVGATLRAYQAGDRYQFSLKARDLRDTLRALNPARYPSDSALSLEYSYNHLGAFPWAAGLYGLGAFCLLIAAGGRWLWLQRAGLLLGLIGLILHGVGIGMRSVVAGRPPVTNMYESMIWVAFVVVAFGFIFYAVYRGATYLLAALPVGCALLLLVQQLPVAVPGAIEPLRPVLRDNFWLTTHVLTITASYGAFALGMAFGHILLFRYLLNPVAARRESTLHFWLYRALQLGVLLLTIGTILGGVWANYSWGRFWNWDPKETWAFITLMCYIVAIHGRIAGWWGQFGIAVASVTCFAAVVTAWYGVNFVLGQDSLHSYGKGIGGENYVAGLLALDALFLAAAIWRQRQASAAAPIAQPARPATGPVQGQAATDGI